MDAPLDMKIKSAIIRCSIIIGIYYDHQSALSSLSLAFDDQNDSSDLLTVVGVPAIDPVLKRAQFNQKINSLTQVKKKKQKIS